MESTNLLIWRERCLRWQEQDLEWALSRFTFIADVTTLAADCHFVGDEDVLVARYDGLPFAAIAFHGEHATLLAKLTGELVNPGAEFYCLVGEEQWKLVQAAYAVVGVDQEWQMLFRGDPAVLNLGDAVPLGPPDLPEMEALAQHEGMMAFERDPLAQGAWYGVRRNGALIAQGGTHLILSRAVEIGNIVTVREYRRRGYGSQVVAALVHGLQAQGKAVFLQVFKNNMEAIACYERLGFVRLRTMYLSRCRLCNEE